MRGQKSFNELIREAGLSVSDRKGRNDSLVAKRNECLLARYYYYGHCKHKCYEDIMRLLMVEFFLSPTTITMLIQRSRAQLQALIHRDPSQYYFQNHWPHLKW